MKRPKSTLLLLLLVTNVLISSCNFQGNREQIITMECIKTFQEFAYVSPESNKEFESKKVLPPHPWKIEAILPIYEGNDYIVSAINVETNRIIDGHQEIWLIESLLPIRDGQSIRNVFLVYYPELREWKTISADVADTALFVQDLFVTSNGDLWGKTVWDLAHGQSGLTSVPVLAKFDNEKLRFEFQPGILNISWSQEYTPYSPWPEILLDTYDIFWVFAKNDGIYTYNPFTYKTEKQADLIQLNTTQATLASDGSMFFEVYNENIYSKESFFHLIDKQLFQFIPKTKEIIPLQIPDEPWPTFSGMLSDKDGKLWLGAIGYREGNGNWHLVHPYPEQYFASAGDAYLAPPTLMLESSDGVLWYRKFLDDIRADGTGWYDPQTGNGCMFTNIATNIIEDSNQTLWLVADGKLFKYQLKQ